jgi:hypothetical protein
MRSIKLFLTFQTNPRLVEQAGKSTVDLSVPDEGYSKNV